MPTESPDEIASRKCMVEKGRRGGAANLGHGSDVVSAIQRESSCCGVEPGAKDYSASNNEGKIKWAMI